MGLFGINTSPEARDEADRKEAEKKLCDHIRNKVEEVRSSANRIAHEGIWMTNIAYLLGYDGITFNTTNRQFQPTSKASPYLRKNRLHVNKVLPTVQNRLARLCKNPPKYEVRPNSNSNDDKEAARLGLQTLTTLWENLSVNKKRLFLYMWVQECGHGWFKVAWDPSKGDPMKDPVTGDLAGYMGDIRGDVVSPFEIFPDPMAKSDDEVYDSWLIQAKVRKLDYFKENYERGDEVKQEDCWLMSAQYEQRINSINARGPSGSSTQEAMKNSAIELIKYEARSKNYPQGRMIVTSNGILLEDKELPCGIIPFAKFDDVIIGGKFYSESIITHLRPIQDQYNTTVRKRAEWTNKLLAGKYKAARGMNLSQESMSDQSGEVLMYDSIPGHPNGPEAIQVPNIPQYAYLEEDRLTAMFNDISGISEVSRGTLPSASIPAIGMQLLTEQDDTRIGVMTEQHEHAWARVGQLILKYVQKYYLLPRKLKFAGRLGYTVKELVGDDLKDNTDVTVIRGSTLPGSKTLDRQEILNAYGQGLLGDPMDPKVKEKVLGMIEFGETSEMWEDFGLDMSQIKRGMDSLEQGTPVKTDELDNHALWIQELNRYRKGDKWDSLDPQIQALFQSTIEEHIQWILKLTNAIPPTPPEDLMAQAQMSGGTPPGAQAPMPGDPSLPGAPPVTGADAQAMSGQDLGISPNPGSVYDQPLQPPLMPPGQPPH